jgi:hypothetical protein
MLRQYQPQPTRIIGKVQRYDVGSLADKLRDSPRADAAVGSGDEEPLA